MTNQLTLAQEIEESINLAKQMEGLGELDENNVIIQVMPNPQRQKIILWSMEDGEPVKVPLYRVRNMLTKTGPDGKKRFTAYKEEAPEPIVGTYKCFLAVDSDERLSGDVAKAGLAGAVRCPYVHGPSEYAKSEHERKKHPNSWRAWQAYQTRKREDEFREEQRQMQRAMLALAQSAAMQSQAVPMTQVVDEDINAPAQFSRLACQCGWMTKADSRNPQASLATHKRLHCPQRNKE